MLICDTSGADEDDEGGEIQMTGARKQRMELDFDGLGMPILPPWDPVSQGTEDPETQRELIRAFVIEHYSMWTRVGD